MAVELDVVRMTPERERGHLKKIRNRFDIAKLIYITSRQLKADREHIAMNKKVAEDIKSEYEFYKGEYGL